MENNSEEQQKCLQTLRWGLKSLADRGGRKFLERIKRRKCELKSFEKGVREQKSKEAATKAKSEKRRRAVEVRHTHTPDVQSGLKLPFCTRTRKWSVPAGVISVTDKELYVQHGVRR